MVKNTVWRYYLFSFFKGFTFFSAVLVPFFTQWGRISLAQIQLLQSWFMLWIFLLEVPTGAIADYFGRKHSLTLGAIILAIAALVYGSVSSFKVFLLAEFLFAAANALISGADKALLYDALKEAGKEEESRKIFGQVHSFHLLGMLIASPLGSLIAFYWGLNAPMLFSAISFILTALIAWSLREPKIQENISESERYLQILKNGLFYLRRHQTLRLLALDAIIVASSAYFVIWFYQPLLTMVKIPIVYFGWFHALLVGAEMLIASNFIHLEKIVGSGKRYLLLTTLITSFAFFIAAGFPSLVTAFFLIIFAGGFGLTRIELISAYMNRFIPSQQRATVISSISMFRRFALTILNPFIGLTADYSLRLALVIVGFLPLATFFFSPIKQEMLQPVKTEKRA